MSDRAARAFNTWRLSFRRLASRVPISVDFVLNAYNHQEIFQKPFNEKTRYAFQSKNVSVRCFQGDGY